MIEVFDDRGARLALREPGRSGGEGTVYAVEGRPGTVCKLYHPGRVDAELRDKIVAMAGAAPRDPAWDASRHRSIAWVQRIVYRDPARTVLAGFTMPGIDAAVFREAHTYFDPADRVARFGGGLTWQHLMTAASNLCSSVAALHAEGHRVGDLRETNLLVAPSALISLIDCDSFQVRERATGRVFHSRVGTAEYIPPELQGADFRTDHDRSYADLFALGVLVFKFLMAGAHPFQARGPAVDGAPSTEAKIARGLFPYGRRARGVEPPPFAPPYDVLPPALRRLFERCFVDGHRRPRNRPMASEWFGALRDEAKRLKRCRANPNHLYGRHLGTCPWCRVARESGADPFPSQGRVGVQTAVHPPARAPVPGPAPAAAAVGSPLAPAVTLVQTAGRRWWRRRKRSVARAAGRWWMRRKFRAGARAVLRARLSKRRALALVALASLIAALVSPLGRASAAPVVSPLRWRARATGACPFDPARASSADPACSATWRLGPAATVWQSHRSFFVLTATEARVRVDYVVTYRTDGRCVLPWVPNAAFNARAAPVCLATCPERIELRGSGATVGPLIDAGGVGARGGPLRCGVPYTGSWTFETSRLRGRARLHYPGFGDVRLPVGAV